MDQDGGVERFHHGGVAIGTDGDRARQEQPGLPVDGQRAFGEPWVADPDEQEARQLGPVRSCSASRVCATAKAKSRGSGTSARSTG
ncbi:hypothetical protein JCM33774_87700 [Actinophytocola sp. KF-1]